MHTVAQGCHFLHKWRVCLSLGLADWIGSGTHTARSRSCRRPSGRPATRSTRDDDESTTRVTRDRRPGAHGPRGESACWPSSFLWTDFAWFRCYGPNNRLLALKKTIVSWAVLGFSLRPSRPGAHIRNTLLTGTHMGAWQTAGNCAYPSPACVGIECPRQRAQRAVQNHAFTGDVHVQTEESNTDHGSTKPREASIDRSHLITRHGTTQD